MKKDKLKTGEAVQNLMVAKYYDRDENLGNLGRGRRWSRRFEGAGGEVDDAPDMWSEGGSMTWLLFPEGRE